MISCFLEIAIGLKMLIKEICVTDHMIAMQYSTRHNPSSLFFSLLYSSYYLPHAFYFYTAPNETPEIAVFQVAVPDYFVASLDNNPLFSVMESTRISDRKLSGTVGVGKVYPQN